jgi:two-component sensor histidine kinase
MASLLNLQSGYVKDENLLQVFKDAESRIWSMALVHETLYRSGNLALIKAKEYVENLVDELCTSYGRDSAKIGLKVDIEDHCFALDTAVTLGLIINELVSNALKHAFPRLDEYGEISVRLVAVDHNEFELTVGDNGVGMVPDTQVNGEKSFGLHLVKALVRQLDGEVNVRAERGTTFVIRFKEADKCTTP